VLLRVFWFYTVRRGRINNGFREFALHRCGWAIYLLIKAIG
jgi:hypothetical protein